MKYHYLLIHVNITLFRWKIAMSKEWVLVSPNLNIWSYISTFKLMVLQTPEKPEKILNNEWIFCNLSPISFKLTYFIYLCPNIYEQYHLILMVCVIQHLFRTIKWMNPFNQFKCIVMSYHETDKVSFVT